MTKPKSPRQWNSTLKARSTPLARGGRPIKKVNPERQAKRRKSYAQKLAAYKRSDTCRVVRERAGGRCEFSGRIEWLKELPVTAAYILDGEGGGRCRNEDTEWAPLHDHHRAYARFGGRELPSDIERVCAAHHAYLESLHPTRNRNYRRGTPE